MATCSKEGNLCAGLFQEKKVNISEHGLHHEGKYSEYLDIAQFDVPYRDINKGVEILHTILKTNDIVVSYDVTNFFQIYNELKTHDKNIRAIYLVGKNNTTTLSPLATSRMEKDSKITFDTMCGKYSKMYADVYGKKPEDTYMSEAGIAIFYNHLLVRYLGHVQLSNSASSNSLIHYPESDIDLYIAPTTSSNYFPFAFDKHDIIFNLVCVFGSVTATKNIEALKKDWNDLKNYNSRFIVLDSVHSGQEKLNDDRFFIDTLKLTNDMPDVYYETFTLTFENDKIQVMFGNFRGMYHCNEYVRAVGQEYKQDQYGFHKYPPILRDHLLKHKTDLDQLLTQVYLENKAEEEKQRQEAANPPLKPSSTTTTTTTMAANEKMDNKCLFARIKKEAYNIKLGGGITPPFSRQYLLQP